MSLILNIDTASEKAHVSFAKDGLLLAARNSGSQKEHAAFLQAAIGELIKSAGILLKDIDAVAVTAGPGSYTGLRVGLASAKGLCYALTKPLITLNTLEILTVSAMDLFPGIAANVLFCPMMDARRMEVFTAVYQAGLKIKLAPCAMILDEFSFNKELSKNNILFFGNGSGKWNDICDHPNAQFEKVEINPQSLCRHSNSLFVKKEFTGLAYSEPIYLKDFQTVIKK